MILCPFLADSKATLHEKLGLIGPARSALNLVALNESRKLELFEKR